MDGREVDLLRKVVSALERSANANEALLDIARREEIVIENGPSICPHCGKLNPEVTQMGAGGSGPLGDFILAGETHCCNKMVYAVPMGLAVYGFKEQAIEALNEKGGI